MLNSTKLKPLGMNFKPAWNSLDLGMCSGVRESGPVV